VPRLAQTGVRMKAMREFDIPFGGLKNQSYVFDYEIQSGFFSRMESSPVQAGDIYVHVTLDKKPRLLVLDFYLDGYTETECDRCLRPIKVAVNGNFRQVVKFDDELCRKPQDDPEVLYVATETTRLNIAQWIYEFIILSLPIQKTCADSLFGEAHCDEKTMRILKEHENIKQQDPRWDKLKDLTKD